jgi:hypothetical protein
MISSILQYSTIDFKFLELNLQQLSKFSDEIIITICDHFFDGEPENAELLNKSYEIIAKYPKCATYTFEWQGVQPNTAHYHNVSRYLGTEVAKNDWLFFVDADEIVDDTFIPWVEKAIQTNNIYWITCYWYWREPIYRATTFEGCGLLIQKDKCNWTIDVRAERQQFHYGYTRPLDVDITFINGQYKPILNEEGKPMMHHFSWYRSKEEMITKVKNWGHKNDKGNWEDLINEEFSRPFNGKDFLHNYQYEIVENKFNI